MDTTTSTCQCNSDSKNTKIIDRTERPALNALIALTSAFSDPRTHYKTDEVLIALGDQFLSAGVALDGFSKALSDLDKEGLPGRTRLSAELSQALSDAATAFLSAGSEALDYDQRDTGSALGEAGTQLQNAGNLLVCADFEPGLSEIFPVYGQTLTQLAPNLSQLNDALQTKKKEPGAQLISGIAALREAALYAEAHLEGLLNVSETTEENVPIHLLPACASCPYVGCTTYCRDVYLRQIGATSSGIFTVVRWDVRRTIKTVCCCYKSAWDRFWAINCCKKVVTTRTIRVVEQRTYIGSPPKAPFTIVNLC